MSKKLVENKTGLSISALIEDIKSDDMRRRTLSLNNVHVIASALGPERTRLELIPFLNDLKDEEDDVLSLLGDNLGKLVEFVGGASHMILLLPLLEHLCKTEEPTIKQKAAATIVVIAKLIDLKKNEEIIAGLIKRFATENNDGSSTRGLLASILPPIFPQLSDKMQVECNSIYATFAKESSIGVRREVAQRLADFISVANLKSEEIIVSVISAYIHDDQEFIRMYMIDACTRFLKVAASTPEWSPRNKIAMVNHLRQLSEDKSWRIKYYLCQKLNEVSESLGKADFKKLILANYIKFLDDSESELKSIAASQIGVVGSNLDAEEIISKLIPVVRTLSSDQMNSVRNQVAGSFLGLSPYLGKKNTIEILLPILLQLLKDEDCEVRVSMFKSLNAIASVVGVDALSQSVLPALSDLSTDKNWRIRASSIEIISYFAKDIGPDFLNDKVQKILFELLSDKVHSVREAAIGSVRDVLQNLGWAWSEKNVIARILALKDSPTFLVRQTYILIIQHCFKQFNADYFAKTIIPSLIALSKDKVANIRFNAAKCFKTISPALKDKERENVRRVLSLLQEDADADVRYYSKQALESY